MTDYILVIIKKIGDKSVTVQAGRLYNVQKIDYKTYPLPNLVLYDNTGKMLYGAIIKQYEVKEPEAFKGDDLKMLTIYK